MIVGIFVVVVFTTIYRFPLFVGLVRGLLFAVVNWLFWRPDGVLRRREKEIPEGPVDMKSILQSVAIGVAMLLLAFEIIWLVR